MYGLQKNKCNNHCTNNNHNNNIAKRPHSPLWLLQTSSSMPAARSRLAATLEAIFSPVRVIIGVPLHL